VDNVSVRRLLPAVLLVSLLSGILGAAGQGSTAAKVKHTTFKVRLIQEQTIRHPHPPAGDLGDVFSTTLRLFAIGDVLGYPDNTPMGTMAFSWTDNGVICGDAAPGCKGKTSIKTLTRLPGGTITANALNVSLSHGLIVPIQSGTGIFKGVSGSISIAPSGVAEDIFTLVLPAA
jgi:hypothetical protein